MGIEITRMSSRGQVVIPQYARAEVNAEEGTVFSVIASGDTLILNKVGIPSRHEVLKQLAHFAKEGTKNAEKLGIRESEVPDMIHKIRKQKRNENNT